MVPDFSSLGSVLRSVLLPSFSGPRKSPRDGLGAVALVFSQFPEVFLRFVPGIEGEYHGISLGFHFMGFRWDFMIFIGFRWDFMIFIGFRWDFMIFIGCRWDFMMFIGFRWDFMGFNSKALTDKT